MRDPATLTDKHRLVVRLVTVRVERATQAERPVWVPARRNGGQAESSVRLAGAHPHNVRLFFFRCGIAVRAVQRRGGIAARAV